MSFLSTLAPRLRAGALLLLITNVSPAAASGQAVIRVIDPELRSALDESYTLSATARDLIERLEQSDLIIHVVPMGRTEHRFTGTMKFVVSAGGRRMLRVAVDTQLPADRRAAALVHELQHALEVAEAPAITDRETFAAWYRRFGRPSGRDLNDDCFETAEALRVGARVLAEYRAAVNGSS